MQDGFLLTAVGDCIAGRQLGPTLERDTGFASAIELLRGSDVGFGNLETGIFELREFEGWLTQIEDWALVGPPEVARDLRALGFTLMSRANNHAVDWSVEGMRQTGRWLRAAGIVDAGSGETLAQARAPRYVETLRGRVGLVAFHTTARNDRSQAMDQFGEVPGRPGVSALRLRLSIRLPEPAFEALRSVERLLDPFGMSSVSAPLPDGFSLFDARFERAAEPAVEFEPDEDDVRQILHAVRSGKQLSDLLIVSAHVHEEGPDGSAPPGFLTEVAHALLDEGADVFIGHGVHHLWPVELYRDKPILYGLGNFIVDDTIGPLPPNLYHDARDHVDPATATDADVTCALNREYFDHERYFESVIARLEWRRGQFTTTLHPVDLGFGMPITRRGVPRLARGERARAILETVAGQSRSMGAELILEGDVAIVR